MRVIVVIYIFLSIRHTVGFAKFCRCATKRKEKKRVSISAGSSRAEGSMDRCVADHAIKLFSEDSVRQASRNKQYMTRRLLLK